MSEPWFETAFGAHYPWLYAHRDETEARRCLDLLPLLAPLVAPVLDLGCGDGRHLRALTRQGRAAVGVDLSAPLLAAARRADPAARVVRGDMRRLPLASARCRTVLSLFTAFGYFGPPAANAGAMAEVARVLAPGGHWFLDLFDGDRVRAELGGAEAHGRVRVLGPCRVNEERSLGPAGDQVHKDVVIEPLPGRAADARAVGVPPQGLRYRESVAVFALEQLDAMAGGLGLTRVAAAGDYDGRPLGEGSRWLLAYRRTDAGVGA